MTLFSVRRGGWRLAGWPLAMLIAAVVVTASVPPTAAWAGDGPTDVAISVYAPAEGSFPACTHILFQGSLEIVTAGDRLLFRERPDVPFIASPLPGLNDAHSVAFDPRLRRFYACDSGHHRLVALADPAGAQAETTVGRLAGIELERPHDIVVDEQAGWIYVLNPNRPTLFRCRKFGEEESSLDLSQHLGYSRALSLVDGRLYVVGSSAGAVVEIEDFAAGRYQVHRSHGKRQDAPAGSWQTTGLVPNDADWFDGHWYVTSYFCPTYAGDTNCDENKLIRFRDWDDFAQGHWDDLSGLLPPKIVPYYLTPHDDGLYIASFSHEDREKENRVYRLSKKEEGE